MRGEATLRAGTRILSFLPHESTPERFALGSCAYLNERFALGSCAYLNERFALGSCAYLNERFALG
jgi:hypothetical protein